MAPKNRYQMMSETTSVNDLYVNVMRLFDLMNLVPLLSRKEGFFAKPISFREIEHDVHVLQSLT